MGHFTRIMAALSKHSRSIRYVLAAITIVLFVLVFGISLNVIRQDYIDITTIPKPRTFEVPININLNGTIGFVEPQISIGLSVTYPNGTLFVDDVVEIKGHVYLKGEIFSNVSMVAVSFQNCLEYPIFEIFKGIPKQGFLQFTTEMSGLDYNKLTGEIEPVLLDSANLTWMNEGDYNPIIGIFYHDGRNSTMLIEDVVIHVYPKEQLTQIQTNKVTTQLAIAAYLFSSLGVASIIIQIYPKKEKVNLEKSIDLLCNRIEQFLKSQESTPRKK